MVRVGPCTAAIAGVLFFISGGGALAQEGGPDNEIGECSAGAPDAGAPAGGTLFRLGDRSVDEAGLPEHLRQALYDIRVDHHRKVEELIETAVLDLELEYRASAAGRPREDVERDLLAPTEPTEEELAAFYEANRQRIGQTFELAREHLREHLLGQSVKANRATVIAAAKARDGFEMGVPAPVAPFAELDIEGLPYKGGADAPVTIVEFADYQCSHCRRAAGAMQILAERYGDRIRIVYMDFPVNASGVSRAIAAGAACADQQGRFWDYHDLAYTHQAALGMESAGKLAQALALDTVAFEACLASPFPAERIARTEQQAERIGLRFTPSVFLNGRRVRMHDFAQGLPALIDALLPASR